MSGVKLKRAKEFGDGVWRIGLTDWYLLSYHEDPDGPRTGWDLCIRRDGDFNDVLGVPFRTRKEALTYFKRDVLAQRTVRVRGIE